MDKLQRPLNRRNTGLIRGLHYFEAVARHRSVKVAAEELGVSQSAVSHQLRELTEFLGEQLLERSGRGIALTPTGQRLAEKLAVSFAGLQSSVEDVVGTGRKALRLAVCSCFGPGWLIPRLPDFLAAHPELDIELRLYAQDPQLTDEVADAIVTAYPVRRGFSSLRVAEELLVAVETAGRDVPPGRRRERLITTDPDDTNIGQDWRDYCAHTRRNLSDLQSGSWLRCTHYLLALEMARAGMGVALVPDFLAQREVGSGTLRYLDEARVPSGRVYHLCFKATRAQEAGIRSLVGWIKLQSEAASNSSHPGNSP